MRRAGIREARQDLTAILEEVRKGHEVVLTDRGRPVARLVAPMESSLRPFSSHRRLRSTVHVAGKPLSESIAEDREDRI